MPPFSINHLAVGGFCLKRLRRSGYETWSPMFLSWFLKINFGDTCCLPEKKPGVRMQKRLPSSTCPCVYFRKSNIRYYVKFLKARVQVKAALVVVVFNLSLQLSFSQYAENFLHTEKPRETFATLVKAALFFHSFFFFWRFSLRFHGVLEQRE